MNGDPNTMRRLPVREATQAEIRATLGDKRGKLVEWPNAGFTFIMSPRQLVIVRAGILGGDVREVHGGWKYLTLGHLLFEWHEIIAQIPSFTTVKKGTPEWEAIMARAGVKETPEKGLL